MKKLLMLVLLMLLVTNVSALEVANATASSVESGKLEAKNVIDDNYGSRWSSKFTDDEWITLDLGKVQKVNSISICWEVAFALRYEIQVSNDAESWENIHIENNSTGGTDQIDLNIKTQYIRIFGIKRATEYGYSIWEINVN